MGAVSATLSLQLEYMPFANVLNVIVLDPADAAVVALEQDHAYVMVQPSVDVNEKLGVYVLVLVTLHAVKIGGVWSGIVVHITPLLI